MIHPKEGDFMGTYNDFIAGLSRFFGNTSETLSKEILMAYTYGIQLESGVYLPNNSDLKNPEFQKKYDDIIDKIVKANPKEYFVSEFKFMNTEEILEYVIFILFSVFGYSKEIEENYLEFARNIVLSHDNSPMNGYCYKIQNLDGKNLHYQVLIPTLSSMSAVACIIHEFMHYYFMKNNIPYKKAYYEEILSILFEKIASDFVVKDLPDKDFSKKIESNRLDCIKFHYTAKRNDLIFLRMLLKDLPEEVYAQKFLKDYASFSEKIAQSYGLGYIYSEGLYNLYKNEPSTFRRKMEEVMQKKSSLQDTLDYFNINMSNEKLLDSTNDKIKIIAK